MARETAPTNQVPTKGLGASVLEGTIIDHPDFSGAVTFADSVPLQAAILVDDAVHSGFVTFAEGGTGSAFLATHVYYASLPGTAGNYVSTADNVVLHLTGDLDLRSWVAATDYTTGAFQGLISKDPGAGVRSWLHLINVSGATVLFWWFDSGGNLRQTISDAGLPFADGTSGWIRTTIDVDDGAGGHAVKYYTSLDYDPDALTGTWTQLGSTKNAGAFTTSIRSSTAALEIGSASIGTTHNFAGKFFRAQVFNGIAGTKVYDANFTNQLSGTTSFADTASGLTVTLNGTVALAGDGFVTPNSSATSADAILYDYEDLGGAAGFVTPDSAAYPASAYLLTAFTDAVSPDTSGTEATADALPMVIGGGAVVLLGT